MIEKMIRAIDLEKSRRAEEKVIEGELQAEKDERMIKKRKKMTAMSSSLAKQAVGNVMRQI